MKLNELHTLKCRFDPCGDPAIFLVEFEKGCVCYPDNIQALCQQHWQTAEPLGDCRVVYEIYERVKNDEHMASILEEVFTTPLTVLSEAMKRYPEQRITQLIFNALDAKGQARDIRGKPRDLFNITDEILLKALEDYE